MSAKNYEFQEDSGGDFFPHGTYAGLLRRISQGLNIELGKKVVSIERKDGIVAVYCSDGSSYHS